MKPRQSPSLAVAFFITPSTPIFTKIGASPLIFAPFPTP